MATFAERLRIVSSECRVFEYDGSYSDEALLSIANFRKKFDSRKKGTEERFKELVASHNIPLAQAYAIWFLRAKNPNMDIDKFISSLKTNSSVRRAKASTKFKIVGRLAESKTSENPKYKHMLADYDIKIREAKAIADAAEMLLEDEEKKLALLKQEVKEKNDAAIAMTKLEAENLELSNMAIANQQKRRRLESALVVATVPVS
jgi:hypothetical protein